MISYWSFGPTVSCPDLVSRREVVLNHFFFRTGVSYMDLLNTFQCRKVQGILSWILVDVPVP
jgi:hypothetical protein